MQSFRRKGFIAMNKIINQWMDGKKVLILGFGREGKATLRVLLSVLDERADIAIADKNPVSLTDEDRRIAGNRNIVLHCGEDYQSCIDAYDVVMKSPGIVLERDISSYRARIVSEMEIFFQAYRDRIIGITGTKGKSTTTTLLYHELKEAGLPVMLAGNIGIPVFDLYEQMKEDTIFVLELSCHQLEYMNVSPKWGILLNIYEEHLDHYGTLEKYVASKRKIYENQREGDILFVGKGFEPEGEYPGTEIVVSAGMEGENDSDDAAAKQFGKTISLGNHTIWYQGKAFRIPTEEISLLGEHNYLDIAFAYGVCREFHISDEQFARGLRSYQPLPHRLQYIGTVDGIKYYDDSISTIDETTIQALNTITDAGSVLIGGMDRHISYEELEKFLAHCAVPHIILMEETGRRIFEEIEAHFPEFEQRERLHVVKHLEDAVALAKEVTEKGRSCILSPAAASYGIFKNFEERGDKFKELVLENEKRKL